MDTRVTKLETKLDTILPMLATKADVSDAKADIIKWLAGVAFAIVAILVSVLAFMLNRAVPPPAAMQQPAPVVVYPQPQQAPQPGPPDSRPAPRR
jgi:hypothetical protein